MGDVGTGQRTRQSTISVSFGLVVLGAVGAFAIANLFLDFKMPIVAPIVRGPFMAAVVGVEAVVYFLPMSLLLGRHGVLRCVAYVAVLIAGRALICVVLAAFLSNHPLWQASAWEWWLPGNPELATFWFCWTDYTVVPACQITWIALVLSSAVWRVTRGGSPPPMRWVRLTAPVLIGAVLALIVCVGCRGEVRGYPARARLEHAAAWHLRYVQHEVAMFRQRLGAYPSSLRELLRPPSDPPRIGLLPSGRRVRVDPGEYDGADLCPEAFLDVLAADGGLWAYSTRPPTVGRVSTRATGRTVALGIPYSRLGSPSEIPSPVPVFWVLGTALHNVAFCDDVESAKLLLDEHADVNATNDAGETPLHVGAEHGGTRTVRLLLGHGASVNAVSKDGVTPLHKAAKEGHLEVVQVLLRYNADVNATTDIAQTPLRLAATHRHDRVVALLRDHGATE